MILFTPIKSIQFPCESIFKDFVQKMYNRLIQGSQRYPKGSKYIPRLEKELIKYKETGNAEHLYNIANYAALEMMKPEHKKFHFNNKVNSVTRGKV